MEGSVAPHPDLRHPLPQGEGPGVRASPTGDCHAEPLATCHTERSEESRVSREPGEASLLKGLEPSQAQGDRQAGERARREGRGVTMEPRISIITLGVADLAASIRFHRDGLGLPMREGGDGIAFFETKGTWLAALPARDARRRRHRARGRSGLPRLHARAQRAVSRGGRRRATGGGGGRARA